MGLREDIEQLIVRDVQPGETKAEESKAGPADEARKPVVTPEILSKARSTLGAKAVVEDFHSRLEDRARRPLDDTPASLSDGSPPNTTGPGIWQEQGVTFHRCSYDARGIVEVVCSAEDFTYDNPIFIVNPPLLVEDPNGDIEQVVGEDESGNPITKTYREDPTQAMIDILVDLKTEGDV